MGKCEERSKKICKENCHNKLRTCVNFFLLLPKSPSTLLYYTIDRFAIIQFIRLQKSVSNLFDYLALLFDLFINTFDLPSYLIVVCFSTKCNNFRITHHSGNLFQFIK